MSAKKPSFGMCAFFVFPFEAWLSRGLAVWHLDKKEPRVPDVPESHGVLVILHYGKYKGAIIVEEKELIRVAGPSRAVLELGNNFHFAFGCSGGDHSLRLYVVSIFTRHGPVSPETAVAIFGATICSRLPATKPQIFPQDPPLVDVCALRDDADPMRWC
ncbi:unnamed protein product [Penicillium camemberti]|uniref:Str. FM013 n=1 Tax=Penicillium camemberti (strain FM 013) TaxID=1429867 RepID=A0A0G4PMK4_PENC3|nr:unnamed protein product [Penicillium camemberti]